MLASSYVVHSHPVVLYQVGAPAQNSAGTVGFKGLFSRPSPVEALLSYEPAVSGTNQTLVAVGDTIAGKTITSLGLDTPAINDRGTVVFSAGFSNGSGIFSLSRLLVSAGQTIGHKTITGFRDLAINDKGKLTFIGSFAGGAGFFTKSKLLVATTDVIDKKTLVGIAGLVTNNDGAIAFLGSFSDGTTGIVARRVNDDSGDDDDDAQENNGNSAPGLQR